MKATNQITLTYGELQRLLTPPRLALTLDEAAASIGVSRDHLERHILPTLKIVYTGRRKLIPIGELERWLANSSRTTA